MVYDGSALMTYLTTGASFGIGLGLIAWLIGYSFEYIVKLFKTII